MHSNKTGKFCGLSSSSFCQDLPSSVGCINSRVHTLTHCQILKATRDNTLFFHQLSPDATWLKVFFDGHHAECFKNKHSSLSWIVVKEVLDKNFCWVSKWPLLAIWYNTSQLCHGPYPLSYEKHEAHKLPAGVISGKVEKLYLGVFEICTENKSWAVLLKSESSSFVIYCMV